MAEQQQAAQQQPEECWFSGVEKINQRFLASFYCSRKMASLVVGNGYHDTISQKEFTQLTNTLLWSRRTYLLKTGHFFFSFWGQAQFLGNSRTAVHLENPPGGLRFRFGSFQEFPWKFFPVLPVLSFDRTMEVLHCFNASWMWANVV